MTVVRILLIRHFESTKNVRRSLSSYDDEEVLTTRGAERAKSVGKTLRHALGSKQILKIFCSSSRRSRESARIMGTELDCRHIEPRQFLRSTSAGVYAGLPPSKIAQLDAKWDHSLQLYKSGVFNLYRLNEERPVAASETKREFETRVIAGFSEIVRAERDDPVFIVANRSAIIAILLDVARKAYGYPPDFYGFVRVDLGSVSVLQWEGEYWRIECVNKNASRLTGLGASTVA